MKRRIDLVEAFNRTLEVFKSEGLTAKILAQQTGVSEATISYFRNRQQEIRSETLYRLLAGLPPEAYLHFFSLFLEDEMVDSDPNKRRLLSSTLLLAQLKAYIVQANDEEITKLLSVVSDGCRTRLESNSRRQTDLKA